MPKELAPMYTYYYNSNDDIPLLLYKLHQSVSKDPADKHYGRFIYTFIPEIEDGVIAGPDTIFLESPHIIGNLQEIFPTTTDYLYKKITNLTKTEPPYSQKIDVYVFLHNNKYYGLTIPSNNKTEKQMLFKSILSEKEFNKSNSNIHQGGRRTRTKKRY